MKYLLIINPDAGNALRELKLKKVLAKFRQHELDIRPSNKPGDATRYAYETNADVVIAAGGDGTVNGVITGMMRKKIKYPKKKHPMLGIIPLGTTNMLARNLKIPLNANRAINAVLKTRYREIDIGRFNTRFFTNQAGVGLDAEFFKNVKPKIKKKLGSIAYPLSMFETFIKYKGEKVKVRIKDRTYICYYILICNFKIKFPPFQLVRKARPNDGLLDVLMFKKRDFLAQMKYLLAAMIDQEGLFKDIRYVRTDSLSIHSLQERNIPAHIDAEVVEKTPVRVRVVPRALKILC